MNKENKKIRLMLKKQFTKEQLLVMKKYYRLLIHNIPYPIINRAYKRYLKKIDDYIMMNGYPKHWFSKDRDMFCVAVKVYIFSKLEGYNFEFGTRGFLNTEIAKLSELDKYLDKM